MEHPVVGLAACIAETNEQWGERPFLVVVRKPNTSLSVEELLSSYHGRVAKWPVPEKVIFIEDMPMTATANIQKMALPVLATSAS